jgi:hypothetical protein
MRGCSEMLLRVGLEAAALATSTVHHSSIRCFLEELEGHSILYMQDVKSIKDILELMPNARLREKLGYTLEKLIRAKRYKRQLLTGVDFTYELPDVNVVGRSETPKGVNCGISLDDISISTYLDPNADPPLSGVESVELDEFPECTARLIRQQLLSSGPIHLPPRTPRAKVWNVCFRPYAREMDHATLVDRYGLEGYGQKRDGFHGLLFLIESLNGSGIMTLNLFLRFCHSVPSPSQRPRPNSGITADKLLKLSSLYSQYNLEGEVVLCLDADFRDKAHARYLRFRDLMWYLDRGIVIFAERSLRAQHVISRATYREPETDVERYLSQAGLAIRLPLSKRGAADLLEGISKWLLDQTNLPRKNK